MNLVLSSVALSASILFVWLLLLFFASTNIVCAFLPRCRITVRWLFSLLFAAVILQTTFQATAPFHLFNVPVISALLLAVSAIVRRQAWSKGIILRLNRDIKTITRLALRRRPLPKMVRFWTPLFVYSSVALYSVVFQSYSLDAGNYHAFKAAMWVKNQGHFTFEAPGWWTAYQLFPGVGSVSLAYFFLPIHGTAFGILADLTRYFALWCVVDVLLWNFKIGPAWRSCATVYILAFPAIQAGVGSHNVDIEGAVYLLTAVVCVGLNTTRFIKAVLLGFALGLALGTKHIFLPAAGLMVIAYLISGSHDNRQNARLKSSLIEGGLIGIAALTICGPWYLRSFLLSGFPLSPLDVAIGPVRLGMAAADLSTSISLGQKFGFREEVSGFLGMFRLPLSLGPSLSFISLVLAPFWVAALLALAKQRNRMAIVGISACFGVIFFYFHPSMKMVRVLCFWENGRFFIAPMVFLVCVLFTTEGLRRKLQQIISPLLFVLGLVHLAAPLWYTDYRGQQAIAMGLGLVLTLVCYFFFKSKASAIPTSVTLILLSLAIGYWRDLPLSNPLPSLGTSSLPAPYRRLVAHLDSSQRSYRIAYISKPEALNNWNPRLPWLGRRFQNDLLYIPISESGVLQPFYSAPGRARSGKYESWRSRLLSKKIDFVASNMDGSLESNWINQHPCDFQFIASEDFMGGTGSIHRVINEPTPRCKMKSTKNKRLNAKYSE